MTEWLVVPVKPTHEMIRAGWQWQGEGYTDNGKPYEPEDQYTAMISAAPKPAPELSTMNLDKLDDIVAGGMLIGRSAEICDVVKWIAEQSKGRNRDVTAFAIQMVSDFSLQKHRG